ncbi:MAG: transglycosylase family protein [Gaiella sp.]
MRDTVFLSHPTARHRLRTVALTVVVSIVLVPVALGHGFLAADQWKPLKKGSRGHLVVHLQQALGIDDDGVFGPKTFRAVKRYQRANALTPDGIVGVETAVALGLIRAETTSAEPASDAEGYPRPTVEEQATLDRIAACESGGDPKALSRTGVYRGKYQFHIDTWRRLGGKGDPIEASEAEQDYRALLLLRQSGTAPWGACANA